MGVVFESGLHQSSISLGFYSLDLEDCKNLSYLPDDIYKLQLLVGLSIPTAKLKQTYDYLDCFSRYGFLMMKPEYFPVLKYLDLYATNIVSILESLSRFPTLEFLHIGHCKQLREIPRLPQSVQFVNASNNYSESTIIKQIIESRLSFIGCKETTFVTFFPNLIC